MFVPNQKSGLTTNFSLTDGRLAQFFAVVMTLFFVLGCLPVAAETSEDLAEIAQELAENRQKWEQSAINAYSFQVRQSCFCAPSITFPVLLEVMNQAVTSSQYDCSDLQFVQEEPLCDSIPESSLNQTVESLFQQIDDAVNRSDFSIVVEYDPTYGFPVSMSINPVELLSDDEISYHINKFDPTEASQLAIKTASISINHSWRPIPIDGFFAGSDSVIFYSAPSRIGAQRGVVRLRGGAINPQFRFQEWSNLDGAHIDERLDLVSISKGRWDTASYQLEVDTVEVSGTEQWMTVNFSKAFNTPPQVIVSLQTANGGDGVSARVRSITETSMQIQLVEEDAKKFSGHIGETAAYLLVASADSRLELKEGGVLELLTNTQALSLNHDWQTVARGYRLRLEEDQTADDETAHLFESIHLIKINNTYLSQFVSDNGNDNAVLRAEFNLEDKTSLQNQINNLTSDLGCDSNEQCKEIAFGAKPCGGPWSFLTYSTRQTDDTGLTAAVTRYNELDRLENERDGKVSDCSAPLPGFPVCTDNVCVVGNQPPPVSSNAAQLTRFDSEGSLEKFLKDGLLQAEQSNFNPFSGGLTRFEDGFSSPPVLDFSPAPPEANSGSSSKRFSDTNIQEQGVDEADFLKTDGDNLYVSGPDRKDIRILEMLSDPYRVTELATIKTNTDRQNLRGMYLLSKRSNQQADLLTTVHAGFQQGGPELSRSSSAPYYPWYWMNQLTEINLYDVSEPSSPQAVKTISIDGSLVASRVIGESLYIVTHFVPNIQPLPVEPFPNKPLPDPPFPGEPFPTPGGFSPPFPGELEVQNKGEQTQVVDRAELIKQASLSDLLPSYSTSGSGAGNKATLVDTDLTFLPPVPNDYKSSDLLTVSRFDLSNIDAPPKTTTLVGNTDTVYVSNNALYFATSIYGYQHFDDVLIALPAVDSPFIDEVFIPSQTTQIHKISLGAEQPVYQGSTNIEGLITGNEDQRRFRFSEQDGALRVVSTGQWGEMGEHRITILREAESGDLQEISHLPNKQRPQRLGKPNERLFATRFVGERLFLVTFQQIDPLIAVDLSDENDPKLQGELEIPGFSDYLHPINDKLLLGIGKHAIAADGAGDGRFSWFQGIRIGLFDISGSDGPKELSTLIIGERGSQSEALFDIHAFSFLPSTEQNSVAKFTIPIAVNGKTFPEVTPDNSQTFPAWSHTGLYLFEVDTSAEQPILRSAGVIKVADSNSGERNFNDMRSGSNRAVLLDDGVFFSHQTQIWSSDWLTPEQAIGPQ